MWKAAQCAIARAGFAIVIAGIVLAPAAPALGRGAAPIKLVAHSSSGSTQVRMWASVRTEPTTRCWGEAHNAGLSARLPYLTTFNDGKGEWRWRIAPGVPAGTWRIVVHCWLLIGSRSQAATAPAAGPAGRWTGRLIARGSVKVAGDTTGTGGGGRNLYPPGECTWWASIKRPDLPWFPDRSGEALNWATTAQKLGFPVGNTPVAGAIAVFQPNQYRAGSLGHVAYVTSVHGSKMTISEAGYAHTRPGHVRTIAWSGLVFIYRKVVSKPKSKPTPIPPPPPLVFVHTVYHTCANNRCGVATQTGPGYTSYRARVTVTDGTMVGIVCQTTGERVTGMDGTSSNVWDQLSDSSYLPDYFVDTSGTLGAFSPPIPRCTDAPPLPDRTDRYYVYRVHGTCGDGLCGLRERTGPAYDTFPSTAIYPDGTALDVSCQTTGEAAGGNEVWDKLTDGFYVSDFYLDTPGGDGNFTAAIPRC